MAYARDYCIPSQNSIQSQVDSQIENLNRRLEETSDLLRYTAPRSRANDRQQRDRLALRLKDSEELRELPRVHKRDDRDDPKAWFPYDRPDRPDRPSRLKKCSDDRDDHMETLPRRSQTTRTTQTTSIAG